MERFNIKWINRLEQFGCIDATCVIIDLLGELSELRFEKTFPSNATEGDMMEVANVAAIRHLQEWEAAKIPPEDQAVNQDQTENQTGTIDTAGTTVEAQWQL